MAHQWMMWPKWSFAGLRIHLNNNFIMQHDSVIKIDWRIWPSLSIVVRKTLLQLCPDGQEQLADGFYYRFLANDSRLSTILTLLENSGLKPWRQIESRNLKSEFYFAHGRHYEAEDFEAFSLLQTLGDRKLQNYIWPADDGTLQVKQPYFKRKKLIDVANIHSLLVSADIRSGLEQAGFRGMVFKPVVPQEQDAVVPLDNLWELTSDQRMPPLSDYCTFFDEQGNPVKGSAETGYQYIEDFYPINELHYPTESVREWPWDFALTHELFSYGGTRHRRRLVVSKRFYNFCQERKLKLDWIPVRIDPD